jgi:hypothetical protein
MTDDWTATLRSVANHLPFVADPNYIVEGLVRNGWTQDEAVTLVQAAQFYLAERAKEADPAP